MTADTLGTAARVPAAKHGDHVPDFSKASSHDSNDIRSSELVLREVSQLRTKSVDDAPSSQSLGPDARKLIQSALSHPDFKKNGKVEIDGFEFTRLPDGGTRLWYRAQYPGGVQDDLRRVDLNENGEPVGQDPETKAARLNDYMKYSKLSKEKKADTDEAARVEGVSSPRLEKLLARAKEMNIDKLGRVTIDGIDVVKDGKDYYVRFEDGDSINVMTLNKAGRVIGGYSSYDGNRPNPVGTETLIEAFDEAHYKATPKKDA